MKAYAIKVKGMGKDSNGMEKIIWATETQYEAIKQRYNDSELRNTMVEIGDISFPVLGVMFMEKRNKEPYVLPKYFIDRYKLENPNENLLDSGDDYNPIA